jgi:alkylation response protein AidB-like acyl-CoA dehydrogenase
VDFTYTEEQQLLAASIRRFVDRHYEFAARRRIVASDAGWSREVWAQLAELGLLGLPLPSDCGGYGGNAVDLISVMEAIGEALIVEPYLATVGLCARLVARGGTPAQRARILPAVAAGKLTMALAQTEKEARYNLAHVTTRARKANGGYRIDGDKRVVLGGPCADVLVVSGRVSGDVRDPHGISLFLVDATAPGVSLRCYRTVDELRAADIGFDNVGVPADALVGVEGGALPLIEEIVDYATALLCAEAVGALKCANDATLEYLKTRKQFGVPIGSFQALQHRMVDMVVSYEQARSMAVLACATVDGEADAARRKRIVSAAKIRIADACRHIGQEAIQLHGGMGMSDELKVSHTFRRLTMIAQQFGDADHHLERFAACPETARAAPTNS